MQPPQWKAGLGMMFTIALGVFLGILAFCCFGYWLIFAVSRPPPDDAPARKAELDQVQQQVTKLSKPRSETVDITIQELDQSFRSNFADAEAWLSTRTVRLTAPLSSVVRLNDTSLMLGFDEESGSLKKISVFFIMDGALNSLASDMTKGKPITVEGNFQNASMLGSYTFVLTKVH